ncbi:BCCT family transporter [Arthrobacter sp. JZ12]|nr:BCCT family transporter [Arthrobacter sp. JZ12]
MGLLLFFAFVFPDASADALAAARVGVIDSLGWYYVLAVALFAIFALWVGFSRFGTIRLGRDGEAPQFSTGSWISLLFASGMGIGLVFWGVAEPLNHYASPRPGTADVPAAMAQDALTRTFLHWGIHAWSVYAVVGLAVAYAIHRKGRPISLRWTLEPLLGRRVKGKWGDAIDVIALVGTVFGIATSLGFGVLQISSGLDSANIAQATESTQIGLVFCLMTVALVSVLSGVERGMKWLSNGNLILAGVILLFVLFTGPTLFVLRTFVHTTGNYFQNIISMSTQTLAFDGAAGADWQATWTTFYWGWWIAWAPFVGVFIAQISRGRTVREFALGVLLVPAGIALLWFSVMGGTALHREMFGEGGLIEENGSVNSANALFGMLDALPGGPALTVGAIVLISAFFITSANSAAVVMSVISTGGGQESPRWVRAFWVALIAVIGTALLLVGTDGLRTIQTAAILISVPFSLIMLLMCASTWKAFRDEFRPQINPPEPVAVELAASAEQPADQDPN